jgi:PAS domain S-box-containing protein
MSTALQVLLLEDDPSSIRLFIRKMQSAPVEITVKEARNRQGFIRELEIPQFDCIVIDYNIPDITGLEALRLSKEMVPDTPLIVYSGSVGEEKAVECMLEGAAEFILKSNSLRLVPAILSVVEKRREREARVRAEEAQKHIYAVLHLSEEKYRDIVTWAPIGIYQTSPGGKFLMVNQSLVEMLGYDSIDELLQLKIQSAYYNVEDRDALIKRFEPEGSGKDTDVQWKKKDGTPIWVQLSAHAVKDEQGNTLYFEGFVHDVTEQKHLEAQFRQAQKMESIGTLAGGIAHDFNNILGIVSGYIVMARQHIGQPDMLTHDIEMISDATKRGTTLVRQLLTFARKSEVNIEPINVNIVVKELVPMLRATFPKTIEITLKLDENIPSIDVDQNQLHQALLNLAVNARDAMPDGGTLSLTTELVSSEKVRKRIPEVYAGEYVHLTISDTGHGMEEEIKSKVFDPFFTTKQEGKGTGLGLAVVYGIIGSHNGFIDIESEVNRGTIMHLYLPVSPAISSANFDVPDKLEICGGDETILIVEDEIPLQQFLKASLEEKGYKVIEASNGAEGVDMFDEKKQDISLIITDLGLPKLNGIGLIRSVMKKNPNTKILLASGYIDPDQRLEILKAGARGLLFKPYNKKEVLFRVREILDATN